MGVAHLSFRRGRCGCVLCDDRRREVIEEILRITFHGLIVIFAIREFTRRVPKRNFEKDPYIESKVLGSYKKENHNTAGRRVTGTHTAWRIQADNWYDARKYVQGTTIAGNRTRTLSQVGKNEWEIDIEEWDV